MSGHRARTTWSFRGPPDALLRRGGEPRRPFSIVRYWLPGLVLGAVIAILGCALAAAAEQWIGVLLALAAASGAPVGYVVPVPRALGFVAAVVSIGCALIGTVLTLAWGTYGVLAGATIWAVSIPAGAIGVFVGVGFRAVARERWYHARFLP